MRFGVNTWVWVSPLTDADLETLVPHIKQMGFDWIEVPLEGLNDFNYAEAAQLIRAHNLGVSTVAAMGPDRDLIHPEAAIRENAAAYLRHCIDAAQILGSPSVVGYVTQTGNAYAANDESDDPFFQTTPFLPLARAELGLPLMIGDQVFGAIVIRHHQPNAFTRDDITVLEVLADQIAVGVQNARLFEATLRRAQREQTVVEITGKIRTSGGIDGILRTAVRELRQALGARQAAIWLTPPDGSNGDGDGGEPR